MSPQAELRAENTRKAVVFTMLIGSLSMVAVAAAIALKAFSDPPSLIAGGVVVALFAIAMLLMISANSYKSICILNGTNFTHIQGIIFPKSNSIDLNRVINMNAAIWRGTRTAAMLYEMPDRPNKSTLNGEITLWLQDETGNSVGLNLKGYDKLKILPLLQRLADVSKKPNVKVNTIVIPALKRWGLPDGYISETEIARKSHPKTAA